jgi:hypothetical protein
MSQRKRFFLFFLTIWFCGFSVSTFSVESAKYRLLSVSESEKLILVSRIPDQTKFLLDASSAKITLNGKPAEYKELTQFSIIQVKMKIGKGKKNSVELDGSAVEINISNPATVSK